VKVSVTADPEQLSGVEVTLTLTLTLAQLEHVADTLTKGPFGTSSRLGRLMHTAVEKYRAQLREEGRFEE